MPAFPDRGSSRVVLYALGFSVAGVANAGAQYPVAPTPVIRTSALTRDPSFSGYLSLRETLRSDSGSFLINRARLAVQAMPATFVAVRLQVDFSALGRTTGTSGDTIPALQITDAFIQLAPPDTSSRVVQLFQPALLIGQFRTPFGLEALTSFSAVITANRSLASDRLSTRRDRGVQAQMRFPRLVALGVAVVDGEGSNRTSNPDGRQMVIGRATLLPLPTLSLSAKWAGQGSDRRWGYDARWVHGGAVLEGELIQREAPTGATQETDTRAGYVLAAYRVLPWLQPVVKWEQYHETVVGGVVDAYRRITYTTAGINVIAPGDRARLQLNWLDRSEIPERKGEFIAQFQAIW